MSATPIPRTLNMALLGIRDMSLITTAPRNRHKIITEVAPFNLDLIRMAILKEVDRGGQVFFVHNRVQSIESVADKLRKTVPEVSFAVAHGQMDERRLEKVMWDFATHKYNCLVSTMIIESGLDIPNVNTISIPRTINVPALDCPGVNLGSVAAGNTMGRIEFRITVYTYGRMSALWRSCWSGHEVPAVVIIRDVHLVFRGNAA